MLDFTASSSVCSGALFRQALNRVRLESLLLLSFFLHVLRNMTNIKLFQRHDMAERAGLGQTVVVNYRNYPFLPCLRRQRCRPPFRFLPGIKGDLQSHTFAETSPRGTAELRLAVRGLSRSWPVERRQRCRRRRGAHSHTCVELFEQPKSPETKNVAQGTIECRLLVESERVLPLLSGCRSLHAIPRTQVIAVLCRHDPSRLEAATVPAASTSETTCRGHGFKIESSCTNEYVCLIMHTRTRDCNTRTHKQNTHTHTHPLCSLSFMAPMFLSALRGLVVLTTLCHSVCACTKTVLARGICGCAILVWIGKVGAGSSGQSQSWDPRPLTSVDWA